MIIYIFSHKSQCESCYNIEGKIIDIAFLRLKKKKKNPTVD